MYGDKSQNAYLEKSALETAVIHGGTNCDTLPDDDPNFKACDSNAVPNPAVNFMKVRNIIYSRSIILIHISQAAPILSNVFN